MNVGQQTQRTLTTLECRVTELKRRSVAGGNEEHHFWLHVDHLELAEIERKLEAMIDAMDAENSPMSIHGGW